MLNTPTLLEILIGMLVVAVYLIVNQLHWINKRLAALYREVRLIRLRFDPDPKVESENWHDWTENLEEEKRDLRSEL